MASFFICIPLRMTTMLWLNLFFPGAGLILRGRLILGASALVIGMVLLGLLILSPLLATGSFAQQLFGYLLLAYCCLGLLTCLAHWLTTRKRDLDQKQLEQLRRLHQEVSRAFLNNQLDSALEKTKLVCKQAHNVIGSWQMLALVADAKGLPSLSRNAHKHIARIQNQDDDV